MLSRAQVLEHAEPRAPRPAAVPYDLSAAAYFDTANSCGNVAASLCTSHLSCEHHVWNQLEEMLVSIALLA